MSIVLRLQNTTFRRGIQNTFEDFTWEIRKNENWVISGSSGSGKTTLLQALQGNFLLTGGSVWNAFGGTVEYGIYELRKHAAFVFFQDQDLNYNSFYYQQRYNSTEAEGTATVMDFLQQTGGALTDIPRHFNLDDLLNKEFIKLSNGETRKVLIAKALLKKPKLLVMDNPFTGLDQGARMMVKGLIDELIGKGVQVIMTADSEDLPEKVSHILYLENFRRINSKKETPDQPFYLPDFHSEQTDTSFDIAVQLTDVVVRYEEKRIIDHATWTIRRNEKWALTGENGAGKSMLLSLIFADHPQAYANEMILFDCPRGNGESIWDIKERIGFLSPEVHFYCDKKRSCRQTALDGLYSNPYKKVEMTKKQEEMLKYLFEYYAIDHLTDVPLSKISTSQQQLVLFIGVLIKDPVLLLLDEPFQGFDPVMIDKSKQILNQYCRNKTLVFVSHYQPEIPECIDHFAFLRNGKLEFVLKKHELARD